MKVILDDVKKWGRTLFPPKIPEENTYETRKAYQRECILNNRIPTIVITFTAMALECFMVFLYIGQHYFVRQASFYPQYIYMYTSMILMGTVLIILLHKWKNSPEKLMKLELLFLILMGAWSALFSAFDVINGFSSYLFVQIMIINSLALKVGPSRHCIINMICYLVYGAAVFFAPLSLTVTFAELVNPFLMVVAACVMIVLNYRMGFASFQNRRLVQKQYTQLEFYANYDFLTIIPNRKYINDHLEMTLRKKPKNIACMMIDIDDFKLYNDTFGHIMGDSSLIQLAAVINSFATSRGGKAGRYGGEEFLVLFADHDEKDIAEIADGLVNAVVQRSIKFPPSPYNVVTISVGVCMAEDPEISNVSNLLTAADGALYLAKKQGKNRASMCALEHMTF